MQLETEVERDGRGDLVGSVCERRMQDQTRRLGGEELTIGRVKIPRVGLHVRKDRSQLFFQPIESVGAESGLAMPGDAHGNDERQQGRAGCPARLSI